MASELLIRYFPAPFPETLTPALLQLAQDALSSPRVQEAEVGAVLMKTILQKYERGMGRATLGSLKSCFGSATVEAK